MVVTLGLGGFTGLSFDRNDRNDHYAKYIKGIFVRIMGAYSKLHRYTARKLYETFPALTIRENNHPEWLLSKAGTRLELDIYIPALNLAAEIQGQQHFEFVPFFHGTIENFKKRLDADKDKRELCSGAGVRLVEICTEIDADLFVKKILGLVIKPSEEKQKAW